MFRQTIILLFMSFSMLLVGCQASTTSETANSTINGQPPNLKLAAQYNVQLGVSYLQQGDLPRAKQKLLLATEQDPESVAAWNGMAYYMQTVGDNASADKAYQKALALKPKQGDTLNNYGVFLCQQGKPKAAINYFQDATHDPAYVTTAQAYENAGLCALKIPNSSLATTFFTKALANDPRLPTANLELAQLAWQNHDVTRAQYYLKRYNRLAKPSSSSLWLTMELAKQQGNKTLVNQAARELKQDFPNSVEYQRYLDQGTTI